MKHGLFGLFILIFFVPASPTQEHQKTSCYKSFRVSGMGKDGLYKEFVMSLRHPLAEDRGFDAAIEEISDERAYRGSGYQVQPNTATRQINCAGYVMKILFGTGNSDVDLTYLKTKVLDVFARTTTSPPKPGDVVVFGGTRHIAVVVERSSSSSSAIIESKDNEQSVVRGKVSLSNAAAMGNYIGVLNDPIIVKNGSPVVYTFVNKPVFEPVSSGDCDPPDLTDQLEGIGPYGTYKTLHTHVGCTKPNQACNRNQPYAISVAFKQRSDGKIEADLNPPSITLVGDLNGLNYIFKYNGYGWGSFQFSPDFTRFTGTFEDKNGHKGNWTGKKE
jgi:hypothetical protein